MYYLIVNREHTPKGVPLSEKDKAATHKTITERLGEHLKGYSIHGSLTRYNVDGNAPIALIESLKGSLPSEMYIEGWGRHEKA